MSELADRFDRARERMRVEHGDYLTVEQVAEIGHCHPKTVRRAISRGEIPAFRFGGRLLIREADAVARIEAEPATPISARSGLPAPPRPNPAASAHRVARMRDADPDL